MNFEETEEVYQREIQHEKNGIKYLEKLLEIKKKNLQRLEETQQALLSLNDFKITVKGFENGIPDDVTPGDIKKEQTVACMAEKPFIKRIKRTSRIRPISPIEAVLGFIKEHGTIVRADIADMVDSPDYTLSKLCKTGHIKKGTKRGEYIFVK